MTRKLWLVLFLAIIVLVPVLFFGCGGGSDGPSGDTPPVDGGDPPDDGGGDPPDDGGGDPPDDGGGDPPDDGGGDPDPTTISKMSLWNTTTKLRGANIWLTRSYTGQYLYQIGNVAIGPTYTQADFNALAALGANYVNISHPGLYSESAPYGVDTDAQSSLDSLLTMIGQADMFAVICFRTGPGRSEFTFSRDEVGDWFTAGDLVETVWSDAVAQSGWVNMWQYVASRYKDNSTVVGYDLMVEPNSDEILGFDDPTEFYPAQQNTLGDWNQFFPQIITAIRSVDSNTPILVGGMGYSNVQWMPYLITVADTKTLYTLHQYAPYVYTHQESDGTNSYPGTFDTDWDEEDDTFNQTWLTNLLTTVDNLNITVAVNEFGVIRWVPNGDDFMEDTFSLFEARNWNHALWQWFPASYPGSADFPGEFNFMFGASPTQYSDVGDSDLMQVIQTNWSLNTLRPSTVTFSATE